MNTNIIIYSFQDEDGAADTLTTLDIEEAKEYGEKHGMLVIGTTYKPAESSTAYDFTPKDRLSRLTVKLASSYGYSLDDLADADSFDPNNLDRFALIESSVYDSSIYVTTHGSREDAASYHDCQECPNDWEIVGLMCLDTGAEMDAETSTRFV